jgi:hypothetical protein
LITDLKSRKQRVHESECVLSAIKQHATEFQTYFSIRDMTREAQEEENYLQSLRDNQKLIWMTTGQGYLVLARQVSC